MKKFHKHILTVLALVFGVIFAACGNPAGDNGDNANNGNNGTTENINFGDITATSTQEEVTNTIKLSLELLQSQTQNIINKLTEYKTDLQQQLAAKTPGTPTYIKILSKIDRVTNIIKSENQIADAQKNRNTEAGMDSMYDYYGLITGEVAKLLSGQADKDIFVAKVPTYQGAVELVERNVISEAGRTARLDTLDTNRKHVVTLEWRNGNSGYSLPDPRTNIANIDNIRWRLETEIKQTLSDDNVLGQYGQYIFYQGEDFAQYAAMLEDARVAGNTTVLPRSVAQYAIQYPAEVNAQRGLARQ